jgi:hypothetical protein
MVLNGPVNASTLNVEAQAVLNGGADAGGEAIINVADPVALQDAVTLNYFQNNLPAGGGGSGGIGTVNVATTAALPAVTATATTLTATANGALLVDTINPAVGATVLVKNQAAPAQNGVYTVSATGSVTAPFVLTRATAFSTPEQYRSTFGLLVEAGATNNLQLFVVNQPYPTIIDSLAGSAINYIAGTSPYGGGGGGGAPNGAENITATSGAAVIGATAGIVKHNIINAAAGTAAVTLGAAIAADTLNNHTIIAVGTNLGDITVTLPFIDSTGAARTVITLGPGQSAAITWNGVAAWQNVSAGFNV